MIVPMRTRFLARAVTVGTLIAAALLLVAACGDDSTDAGATTDTVAATTAAEPGTTGTTPTTTGPKPGTTTSDGTTTMTIVVRNAAPVGGIQRATVKKGDTVVLLVHSDVDDEVHLHGYNFWTDVDPTVVGRIDFVADVAGRFEVEVEERGVKIAELTVTP
jgi:hypothetical protein